MLLVAVMMMSTKAWLWCYCEGLSHHRSSPDHPNEQTSMGLSLARSRHARTLVHLVETVDVIARQREKIAFETLNTIFSVPLDS